VVGFGKVVGGRKMATSGYKSPKVWDYGGKVRVLVVVVVAVVVVVVAGVVCWWWLHWLGLGLCWLE